MKAKIAITFQYLIIFQEKANQIKLLFLARTISEEEEEVEFKKVNFGDVEKDKPELVEHKNMKILVDSESGVDPTKLSFFRFSDFHC